jgi:peptidoglycan/LPS O-acetylase OafA/YrhL
MRLITAIVLLAVAFFCGYGFLATFEPPGWPITRIVYVLVGVACLVGAGRSLILRKPSN